VDNELNRNIQSVVENTKEENITIVLLIDESHHTSKSDKSKELIDIISPRLIIEITATPKESSGNLIDIPLKSVIAEGMIKKEIQINQIRLSKVKNDDDLLVEAIYKRNTLQKAYTDLGKDINPLLLVQIPNKKSGTNLLPETKIIKILNKQNITIDNGKLAIWLSEDKRNKEDVEINNSKVEVLIFKEAIALGWDCPRASILFLQREWHTEKFEFNIQTLGRIMRMPEQIHYQEKPELNIGYVYSATDNFSVIEELADDYVSEQKLTIDNSIYAKKPHLISEHVRRKRELTRLSSDFKDKFNTAANNHNLRNIINKNVKQILKRIKTHGQIKELDKSQKVELLETVEIVQSKENIQDAYDDFIHKMVAPYEITGSQSILKTAIRSWFKKEFNMENDIEIQCVVMDNSQGNNSQFKQVIEDAKELYKKLPIKTDQIIRNENWEIPDEIRLFSNFRELEHSKKSILKHEDRDTLLIGTDKNGKIELSKPEVEFIEKLEQTNDNVCWWFRNGKQDAKYFSIVYEKDNGHHYCFYPDFIIKTIKETIIVEIKDDKDFKTDNYYKYLAGKNYINKLPTYETTRFYILSPDTYFRFFKLLDELDLDSFNSLYEERLDKFTKSQQFVVKHKIENNEELSKLEEENKELWEEIDKLEKNLKREKNLEMRLEDALKTIENYKSGKFDPHLEEIKIPNPFNICVLGEVTDEAEIRKRLNLYFQKLGISTNNWNIEFFSNTKIQNSNILKRLVKWQTNFNVVITGQIYRHSGKNNKSANLLSELKDEKYIPHIVGCSPKENLTIDQIVKALDGYISKLK
jgi:type III restriction enzyme